MSDWTPEELKGANARYLWHPMAQPKAMRDAPPDIIVRGEGCWIWDADGNRLIDGVAGLWSANLGFGRREIRDAIVAQLDVLPYFNVFRGTTHPRAIELSSRVVKLMEPDGVAAVFFSNGGSDAVEGALKLARQYWKIRGQGDRTKFIALRQGYHGVHFGGMSVNGNTNFRRPYEPMLPGCFHVDTPWVYRNPYTEDPTRLGEICAELLEREILFQGPDTVAAFIAEPVQGAGGVIVPPANYWPLIRKVCDKHGVLLIADEVVTGFGRTGHLFGTRMWDVKADLWCLAKGISSGYVPLGATAISSRVAEAFDASNERDECRHPRLHLQRPSRRRRCRARDPRHHRARERHRERRRAGRAPLVPVAGPGASFTADRRCARRRIDGVPRDGGRQGDEEVVRPRRDGGVPRRPRGLSAWCDDPHLRAEHHPLAGSDHRASAD